MTNGRKDHTRRQQRCSVEGRAAVGRVGGGDSAVGDGDGFSGDGRVGLADD